MGKVKAPSVADKFYPADKNKLTYLIDSFVENSINQYDYPTRMVIVPHAALIYSGRQAYEGICQINKSVKTLFIFAPAHKLVFDGTALSDYKEWETPFGKIKLDRKTTNEFIKKFDTQYNDDAFENEHSIEVLVPIIQYCCDKNVKIIPVLVSRENSDKISAIIKHFYKNEEYGFIISSDLSHYLSAENAQKIDATTAEMIETGNIKDLNGEHACGSTAIRGAVDFANKNGWSFIRTDLINSSSISKDKTSVVGYGTWFLYEGRRNDFIKEYFSKLVILVCKSVIQAFFDKQQKHLRYPNVLSQKGATFVTLKKKGALRGCIGSMVAYQPLINDIIANASKAAFKDPRFKPLEESETEDIEISVSVLSNPVPMKFKDEKDLLEQLVPGKDGLIIKDGNKQAVYLPMVWDEVTDKRDFLNSLKVKAGFTPDYFSKTFTAFRFDATYITNKE